MCQSLSPSLSLSKLGAVGVKASILAKACDHASDRRAKVVVAAGIASGDRHVTEVAHGAPAVGQKADCARLASAGAGARDRVERGAHAAIAARVGGAEGLRGAAGGAAEAGRAHALEAVRAQVDDAVGAILAEGEAGRTRDGVGDRGDCGRGRYVAEEAC